MAKIGLYPQEDEILATSILLTSDKKGIASLLLNFEFSQKRISAIATPYIYHAPTDLIPPEERLPEIEDNTQDTWERLLRLPPDKEFESPIAYLTRAAHSVSIDNLRKRKCRPTSKVSLSQEGEVQQGNVLLPVRQEMQDPSALYELKESLIEYIDAIVLLPARQMYAMICELKDELGASYPLAEIFRKHGIDIAQISWPRENPKELQSLHSSLSQAKAKLREKFHRPCRKKVIQAKKH